MIIYPAIDMRGGKCVRLRQGNYDDMTVYENDPLKVARKWEELGASYIHLVDLDGARAGESLNGALIQQIAETVKVPVQVGGGIRTLEDIRAKVDAGVSRVILGTVAIENPSLVAEAVREFGDIIAVGIDAKDGMVATHGWEQVSDVSAVDFALKMAEIGVKTIIYTDIATDGMLGGCNVKAMAEMAAAVPGVNIIASGGIGSLSDIRALLPTGVGGVIVGKALYDERFTLPEAIEAGKGEG